MEKEKIKFKIAATDKKWDGRANSTSDSGGREGKGRRQGREGSTILGLRRPVN